MPNPEISCNDGYGITRIKHELTTNLKIRYEYTCCKAAVTGSTVTCDDVQTSNKNYNDLIVLNLDRLMVDTGQYRFISSIKLNDIGEGQWNCTYKSCEIDKSVITSYDTGCKDQGSGSIFYFDRH
jgi:hypothetical protein